MVEDQVKCPICGAPMVLRVARKGPNAGSRFYGCSRWSPTPPSCPGTRPYESSGKSEAISSGVANETCQCHFPRSFLARPLYSGHQCKFFQVSAIPFEASDSFLLDPNQDNIRFFSQWRLDYPVFQISEKPYSEIHKKVFSVAEKILLRGIPTFVSPHIEKILKPLFNYSEKQANSHTIGKELFFCKSHKADRKIWLDSDAECLFYEKLLPVALGPNFERWVIPQCEISSLLNDSKLEMAEGRVDFLISVPFNDPLVIEIDGQQHQDHRTKDLNRDTLLTESGYKVLRFTVDQIYREEPTVVKEIKEYIDFSQFVLYEPSKLSGFEKYVIACQKAHQIELTLLYAILYGALDVLGESSLKISTDLHKEGLFSEEEARIIMMVGANDIIELLSNLLSLYPSEEVLGNLEIVPYDGNADLHISFTTQEKECPTFFIQKFYIPFDIRNSTISTEPQMLDEPSESVLKYFLNYLYRKPIFWEGQFDAISRTLQGKDSLVLLPTGGGKSIAFQLAALLLPGSAVVVDPIISLMDDQIDNLSRSGIHKAIAINSQMTRAEVKKALELVNQGEYIFIYVAPERFQTDEFRLAIRGMTVHTPVSLVAIDEAHCVSEWGHDFRTSYLNIGRTTRKYCCSINYTAPLLGLTGTASRTVLKDIQRELDIDDFEAIITPKTFDRAELQFSVIKADSSEKFVRLTGLLNTKLPSDFNISFQTLFQQDRRNTYSGLIFCPHVGGEFGVVDLSKRINQELRLGTSFYSGKAPKNYRNSKLWNFEKKNIAKRFKNNQTSLMICTKAFGMGIDKPNIRYTIHYGLPQSIESFYQEAGRAGRDRRHSICTLIVSNDNEQRTRRLLNPNTSTEEIIEILRTSSWEDQDDITRAMYFLTKSFPGISQEITTVKEVVTELGEIDTKRTKNIIFKKIDKQDAEKAIHRLLLLGIIEDYTIDYSSNEFKLKLSGVSKEGILEAYGNYVANYQIGRKASEIERLSSYMDEEKIVFLEKTIQSLLHFIYDVIEKGRRQALSEMLIAASLPDQKLLRQRILRYLEATQYSENLEKIVNSGNAGLDISYDIFSEIRSRKDAEELRGQVARYLESYPDQPCLRMLRALSETYSKDTQIESVVENFIAALESAKNSYSVKNEELKRFVAWGITKISKKNSTAADAVMSEIVSKYNDPELCREIIEECGIKITQILARYLLYVLTQKSQTTLFNGKGVGDEQ